MLGVGSTLGEGITLGSPTTVTVQLAVFPKIVVAVITVSPMASATTFPSVTDATSWLDDSHVTKVATSGSVITYNSVSSPTCNVSSD